MSRPNPDCPQCGGHGEVSVGTIPHDEACPCTYSVKPDYPTDSVGGIGPSNFEQPMVG